MTRWLTGLLMALLVAAPLSAQGGRTYTTRLSPVPVAAYNPNIVGTGTVTATVTGNKLVISGTYERLASAATEARLMKSAKPGIRGETLFDLRVTGGTSGTITGIIDLTNAQLQEIAAGRYYVQLHSEKAADGNLWGWLQPQEKGR
jgi:hypothetical protein